MKTMTKAKREPRDRYALLKDKAIIGLLTSKNAKEAAAKVGITEQTLCLWRERDDFKKSFVEAQGTKWAEQTDRGRRAQILPCHAFHSRRRTAAQATSCPTKFASALWSLSNIPWPIGGLPFLSAAQSGSSGRTSTGTASSSLETLLN
jgi:hypothetical protein